MLFTTIALILSFAILLISAQPRESLCNSFSVEYGQYCSSSGSTNRSSRTATPTRDECRDDICAIATSGASPSCPSVPVAAVNVVETVCSATAWRIWLGPGGNISWANISASLSAFLVSAVPSCVVSHTSLFAVEQCFESLSCRSPDATVEELCAPRCILQSLSCVLRFACQNRHIFDAVRGLFPGTTEAAQCVNMVPIQWLVCQASEQMATAAQFCAEPVAQLTRELSPASFVEKYTIVFVGAGAVIGGVLCVFGFVACGVFVYRKCRRYDQSKSHNEVVLQAPQRQPLRQRSAVDDSMVQQIAHALQPSCASRGAVLRTLDDSDAAWFDPPTIVDRRGPSDVHSGAAELKWDAKSGWGRQRSFAHVVEPNGREASERIRPAVSTAVDLFDDSDAGSVLPSASRSSSRKQDVSEEDGLAKMQVPVYRRASDVGGSLKHQRSAASLRDLQFDFTDASSATGADDEVQELEPGDFADDRDVAQRVDTLQTPTSSDADGEGRLVYDQESLVSSVRQRDQSVPANAFMTRREILAAIVEGRFVRGRLLGRGSSGCVYQMCLPDSSLSVAVKEMDVQRCTRDELSKIISRYNFLCRLSHRHIAELYLVRYDPNSLSLHVWMEYVDGGTLQELARKHTRFVVSESVASGELDQRPDVTVRHRPTLPSLSDRLAGISVASAETKSPLDMAPGGDFPESIAIRYVSQLLSALSYLHKKGVIHRDIKGSNVLLSSDSRVVKVVDLDCCFISPTAAGGKDASRRASLEVISTAPPSVAGSPLWMPPEILSSASSASPATDVWSVGITVAEMLMGGELPWPPFETTFLAMMYISQKHSPVLRRTNVSDLCRDFLARCWTMDVKQRGTAMDLRTHPWLQRSRPSSFRRSSGLTSPRSSATANHSFRSTASDPPGWMDASAVVSARSAHPANEATLEEELKRIDEELDQF